MFELRAEKDQVIKELIERLKLKDEVIKEKDEAIKEKDETITEVVNLDNNHNLEENRRTSPNASSREKDQIQEDT